jgi:hypothetical protein
MAGLWQAVAMMRAVVLMLGLIVQPVWAEGRLFGYVGTECGLGGAAQDGYTAEVTEFSNLNMVCVTADPSVTADRIRRVALAGDTVLLNVQPALFDFHPLAVTPSPARDQLWPLVVAAVRQSGVPPGDIILYIVDEPALRQLPIAAVEEAITYVRRSLPGVRTMAIEYREATYDRVPKGLTYWGFFDYFHRDPGAVPDYVAALDRASAQLGPDQRLVLVMDAHLMWMHEERGLAAADMADIARAYGALAMGRTDVAVVMAYTWAGGIDYDGELGVRDMGPAVLQAHREVGLALIAP